MKKSTFRIISIATPLLLLIVWEITARLNLIDVRFFPAPTTICRALVTLAQSGELWRDLTASLLRILAGFLCGAIPGIVLGLLMGIVPFIRAAIQPLVNATFPIPKSALFPLFLVLFGLGEASKVAVIAIAVIYLVLLNTMAGVVNIPTIYTDVGRNFKASRWLFFWDIALPGALPYIFSGLKLGMGVALLVIVVAEFSGADAGIGYLIWNAWSVFQIDQMYAGLLVIALLGTLLTFCLDLLEHKVVRWKM